MYPYPMLMLYVRDKLQGTYQILLLCTTTDNLTISNYKTLSIGKFEPKNRSYPQGRKKMTPKWKKQKK